MRNLVSEYASQFRQDRQKQIKLGAVLAALAVIVAGVVFWQLHNTGVAMTNEVFCGQEEHIHDDACYEELLVCDSEDENHVHDDSCYETVLTCEIPEHTHTVECLIDEAADVETAGDWEATLPEELSGIWADDVVAIAESQVGYTESELNFQLAEDGETHQGYTRYGAWYGNEYGDWDAMFVSFCLNYAGVPEEVIPENSGAWALSVALDEDGLYVEDAEFTPEAGDLVFFDQDEDGRVDTVGIVAALDNEDEITLTVIEGNSSDAVEENTYEAGDETIIAFAVLPEQPDEEEMMDATGEQDADVNGTGKEAEIISDDAVVIDGEETEETYSLMFESEDYSVSVIYGADAELPEDTELMVSEYESDSETYADRFAEATDLLEQDGETLRDARLFDISLMADCEEVEPEAQVEVKISLASQTDAVNCSVVHFSDETLRLDADTCDEDEIQTISFMTDSFSDFMVVYSGYGIQTLEAEAGKLEIYKFDDTQNSWGGYFEGYYVWVPEGTYAVVVDVTDTTTGQENGEFYYVGDTWFWEENGWYVGDYTETGWIVASKSVAAVIEVTGTSQNAETGEWGNYVFFKFDDNEFHDLYDVYLIEYDGAPDRCNGDNLKTNYSNIMYQFEEFYFDSADEGELSGAEFILYGKHNSDFEGYAYFTLVDGTYQFVGWYTDYGEYDPDTVPDDSDLPEGCTFYITTGSDGYIYIDGLPDSWIEFTLHEVSAPDGYSKLTEDVHFTWNYDGRILPDDSWSDDDLNSSGGTISISNDPTEETLFDLNINKYGSDSNAGLEGAQFIMSRSVTESDGSTTTEYAEFVKESDGTYSVQFYVYGEGNASVIESDEDGAININSLHTGTYTLTEVKAPSGYTLLDEPIVFTLETVEVQPDDPNGEVTYESKITIVSGSSYASVENGVISISNDIGGLLPNTGGVGTWIFTVTGLVLISGAGVLLYSRKRRAVN